MEELLRLRESQLTEAQTQHGRVSESLQFVETERKKEKVELETVVMELQSQLSVFASHQFTRITLHTHQIAAGHFIRSFLTGRADA